MAVFCNIIAGIFCLHISYPTQPGITASADTNGLMGSVHAQGAGWQVNLFASDMLQVFNPKDASHVCVRDSCLDFRRKCNESEGHVHCVYDLNLNARYLTSFSLDADDSAAQSRAVQSVALYRGEGRQSDFPLALLDQAAKPLK